MNLLLQIVWDSISVLLWGVVDTIFLPTMNNSFVSFWKMAIKIMIKKVVVTRASESEHSHFTQVSFKALS